MRRVTIDGSSIQSPEEFHALIARELSFPEYYGRNLDALWDCLTDPMEETELKLKNVSALCENFGPKGKLLLHVLQMAAEENEDLHVVETDNEESAAALSEEK